MHQIAVSVFIEETGKLNVTNRQYGIMFVLFHQPGIDQISVANASWASIARQPVWWSTS